MKRPTLASIVIALAFGAACAAFGLLSPRIWNSPDETATAYFAQAVASGGHMWSYEPANLFGSGSIHPRSMISIDANLVPGSFYGAIFYFAALVRALGAAGLSLGTPLATALASVAVFFALRRALGERSAVLGQILFWLNPAVWYFTARGLYPNMLFIDCAIIGLAALMLRPWKAFAAGRGNALLEVAIDDFVGLAFLGAGLLIRPVEFIWLGPILLVLAFRSRRSLKWYRLAWGVLILAAFAGTLLVVNSQLYGSPWSFGYTAGSSAPGVSIPAIAAPSRLPAAIAAPRPFVLPFGFHPHLALANALNYLVLFAWWLPLLAGVGFALTRNRAFRRQWGLALAWTAAVLAAYYGSGSFSDSTVSQWTVGSSYLRYFLPASLLLVPFAAEGLAAVSAKRRWIAPAALAACAALSVWTVCFRSPESLAPMASTLKHYAEVKADVLKEVPPGSVIVTERSDKVFFPDRRVMIGIKDKRTLDEIPRLLSVLKVYYYGVTLGESDLRVVNAELRARHLQLGRIRQYGNEMLYGITWQPK